MQKTVFYEKILNKSMALIGRYWTKSVFSGTGTPPAEFANVQSLVKFLRETPAAMAYLPSEPDHGKLKVVDIVP